MVLRMPWTWRRAMVAAGALMVAACGLHAEPPSLLPGKAFVVESLQPCRVDPYADTDPGLSERQFLKPCGADRLQFSADGPRPQTATTVGPTPFKLGLDQSMSSRMGPLTTSVRFGWAGLRDDRIKRMQTEHALVAAGGLFRLDDDWAVDMSIGRDVGAGLPQRAMMTGLWRPGGDQLVFAQFADDPGGVASMVGLRWWLVPKRVAVDVAARRSSDGQLIEPRLNLSLFEFGR